MESSDHVAGEYAIDTVNGLQKQTMPPISKKIIEHVALLARLELSEEEKEVFGSQLGDILKYIEKLKPSSFLSIYKDFFTYINEKNGQLYFNYFDGSLNPRDYL